jgi:phosphate transport system permease protein
VSAVDATAFHRVSIQGARLPRLAPYLVLAGAVALSALVVLLLGWGWVAIPVLAVVVADVALPVWARLVEGRRAAADRLVTCLVWTALGCALVPLAWVLIDVLKNGVPAVTGYLLTHDGTPHFDPATLETTSGGGALHALIGTMLVTLGAAVISVPVGLMTAIYLVEYGRGTWIARGITLLVDVMTGIPSIVAGLFALALFTLFDPALRMGLMGSVALSLLMIPTVVRSAEEMMRLVPNDLREASYALGVAKWRTVVKVVLRTSLGGIITGVMLAVSRVIGETAPLLVAVGAIDSTNWNLFSGRMETLPVFIMSNYSSATTDGYKWAWAGALLLIVIVMVLNLVARIIGKIFAPKTGR